MMMRDGEIEEALSRPKPREGTTLWFLKIITGVLMFVFILVHIVVNHLVVQGGLKTFDQVIAYLSNPWIAAMEIAFLVLVVSHALLGLRGVILDLSPSDSVVTWLDRFFILLGVVSVGYGAWLIEFIVHRGV